MTPTNPKFLCYTSPEFNLIEGDSNSIDLLDSIFLPPPLQSPSSSSSNRAYSPLNGSPLRRSPSEDCYFSEEEIYFRRTYENYVRADRTVCVFQIRQGKFDAYLDSLPENRRDQVIKFFSKDTPKSDNAQLIYDLESLLFFAVNCNCPSMIRLILAHEMVNIHAKDCDGNTALHKAVQHQSLEAIKTLLLEGASDRIPNHAGITPFDFAQLTEFDEFLDIRQETYELKESSISEDLSSTI